MKFISTKYKVWTIDFNKYNFSTWKFFKVHYHIYILTYLLTYSMVQSPSWQANWFVASQEIPRISRNPKVHYRTHKRPPPLSYIS